MAPVFKRRGDGMARFESRGQDLYIDGKKVVKAWESFSGWFWFATEKARTQNSILADGTVGRNDTIWFGLVQGLEEEWGYWSEAELKDLMKEGRVWEIRRKDLPYAGRR